MSTEQIVAGEVFGVFLVEPEKRTEAMKKALQIFNQYGGIEGDHHRTWVLDQIVRALTGPHYEVYVLYHKHGENGSNTYSYDCGTPP